MPQVRKGNTLNVPDARKVYEVEPNARHIVSVWMQATLTEVDAGLSWYRDAHAIAHAFSPTDVRKGAGVLAALSPMTPWDRNIMLAARAFEDGEASGTLFSSVAKANRILAGEDPLDVLGGGKVRAFFMCIAEPDNDSSVCIDRHAFDVAVGQITNNNTRGALSRVGVYDRFAESYKVAAKIIEVETEFSVIPSQVQAVTWVTWRRLKGLE